jgi:cell division protein FtsZ
MPDILRLGQGEPVRPRIAVVGCGGAGCNILQQVPGDLGLTRVAMNDAAHRSMAGIPSRLILPRESLVGLAQMDETAVKVLSSPEEKAISGAILNHDLVVPVAGLGGETGGPAAALVGRVARILGTPALALVASPFAAEGLNRRASAERGLELLAKKVDGVVAFSNDELLKLAPQLPLLKAFQVLGAIMVRPLVDLAWSATRTDIPTLRDVLRAKPRWRFGGGSGEGKHRAFEAVEEAFASPWLPPNPDVVERVVAIVAAPDFGEAMAGEVAHEVRLAAPRADVLLGGYADPALGGRLRVSILAGS